MEEKAVDGLPWFDNVLVDTQTHREDWLAGQKEIAAYIGIEPGSFSYQQNRGALVGVTWLQRVRAIGSGYDFILVARKSEVDAWKQAQQVKEAKANGTAKVIITTHDQPIMAPADADAVRSSIWQNKLSTDASTKAVERLASSIDANTQALRNNTAALEHQTKRMGEIFDGQKQDA